MIDTIVIYSIMTAVIGFIFGYCSTKPIRKKYKDIIRLQDVTIIKLRYKNEILISENRNLIDSLDEGTIYSLKQQITRMHEKYNKLMMDNLNMRFKLGLPLKDENNTFDGDF